MVTNSKDSRQRYNLLSVYDPNEYQGRDAGESSPSYRQNAVGRYVEVPQQKQTAAAAAPAKPQFGLEGTQSNWVDNGSAEHLVKDYSQRNSGLSDEEKTLEYWQKRAGVKDINRQEDINQIERTMRNREHELATQRSSQQSATPTTATEAKPFNAADYAPKSSEQAADGTPKKASDYLTQTLESLKSNSQSSAYEDFQAKVKSRDEKVARGEIDPLTSISSQDAPASQGSSSTGKWAEYAAAFGYGPDGHRIDRERKASSSRFLDQLRSDS